MPSLRFWYVVCLTCSSSLAAQEASSAVDRVMRVGARVRLSQRCGDFSGPSCHRIAGTVQWFTDRVLVVLPGDGSQPPVRVPLEQLSSLDVSGGRRSHARVGAAVGFGVGAVLGALSGAAYARTCNCANPNYGGGIVNGALLFGVPGALLGGLLGSVVRTDRWVAVPLAALRRDSPAPQARGLRLGAAVRF